MASCTWSIPVTGTFRSSRRAKADACRTPETGSPTSKTPQAYLSSVGPSYEREEAMTKPQAYELRTVPVHLGPDARAEPIEGWAWDPPTLAAYAQRVAAEGEEGRLITW